MNDSRMVYYDDGNTRMVWEFYRGKVYVHLKVKKWGPSVLRLMRAHWPVVRARLGEMGYPVVHAFYRCSNRLMPKFAAMFGFREVERRKEFVILESDHA